MNKRFEIKREGKKYVVLRADGSVAASAQTLRSAKDFVAIENWRASTEMKRRFMAGRSAA